MNHPNFLNVYLQPHNPDKTPWKINVDFKITVLNQAGGISVSNKRRWAFSESRRGGYGFEDLISMKRLKRDGFIKNNKIQLKIEMVAEKMIHRDVLA